MVEENKILDFRVACDLYSLKPARMSPPLARRGELLGGILRIVDQDICSVRELSKTSIQFRHAGLVIGSIDDRSDGHIQAIAETTLRMIHPSGGYARPLDFPFFAASDFPERAQRCHRASALSECGLQTRCRRSGESTCCPASADPCRSRE